MSIMFEQYGNKAWYEDGELHRLDGPAVESSNGYQAWYIRGKRHREDGPAVEFANGTGAWWIDGLRHRLDGPAVEHVDAIDAYWIHGECLTPEEFDAHPERLKYLFEQELERVLNE